jgi:hypothetical protein
MVRMALAGNRDSKRPSNISGWCLTSIAEAAGLDMQSIRKAQQEIADTRKERIEQRIKDLEKKKEKLKQIKLPQRTEAAA